MEPSIPNTPNVPNIPPIPNTPNPTLPQTPNYTSAQAPNPALPQVPTPAQAQASNSGIPNKKNLIVIALAATCFAILSGAILALSRSSQSGTLGGSTSSQGKTKFENLTKDEAYAFLQSQGESGRIKTVGYIQDELLNAVRFRDGKRINDLRKLYSYGTMEELQQLLAEKSHYADVEYQVTEYDYYAIATPKGEKCEEINYYTSACDSWISFKRDYLDDHEEYTTFDGHRGTQEEITIKTGNPSELKPILAAYSFSATSLVPAGKPYLYDYTFKEQDNSFIMTVYYVMAGTNLEIYRSLTEETVANYEMKDLIGINLVHTTYSVDKTTLEFSLVPDDANYLIKSYPLTEEEFSELSAKLGY